MKKIKFAFIALLFVVFSLSVISCDGNIDNNKNEGISTKPETDVMSNDQAFSYFNNLMLDVLAGTENDPEANNLYENAINTPGTYKNKAKTLTIISNDNKDIKKVYDNYTINGKRYNGTMFIKTQESNSNGKFSVLVIESNKKTKISFTINFNENKISFDLNDKNFSTTIEQF